MSIVPDFGDDSFECSEHGGYDIGPDCPKCVEEVLTWTA